jgi:hypothetical protein
MINKIISCGVSWHQNHVTLDCRECGGYAMERPCPECDGKCDSQWRRNLTAVRLHSFLKFNLLIDCIS